jgi:uncharacterized membrane protein
MVEKEDIDNRKKKAAIRKERYNQKQKSFRKILIGLSTVIVSVVIIVSGIMLLLGNTENPKVDTQFETPIESADEILIPLADLSESAQFYSYNSDGVYIDYFAVKGADGEVHVALDACDLCYSAKKGYEQIDDIMRCINCGRQFPIVNIGTENTAGGCWPSYIPIIIDDEQVTIKVSDLEAKRFMCQ